MAQTNYIPLGECEICRELDDQQSKLESRYKMFKLRDALLEMDEAEAIAYCARYAANLIIGGIREDLNEHAIRVMGVLKPLKVTIENYPDDQIETLTAKNHHHLT